jgi:hypothetical protein
MKNVEKAIAKRIEAARLSRRWWHVRETLKGGTRFEKTKRKGFRLRDSRNVK